MEVKKDPIDLLPMTTNFEEFRQRLLANTGLLSQQSNQPIAVDLNGSIIASETKSPCSTNEDDRKQERDKALARYQQGDGNDYELCISRLWADNETLLSNTNFRDFVHCLAPEYEIPEAEILASTLIDSD